MTTSKIERVYTSLMRNSNGSFGFSISGGKGADPYIEGDESVYISKVVEHGPAHRDGKIRVGDKLVQIDGIDVSEAEHVKVVEMLTARTQFVRLCVERRQLELLDSSGSPDGKSPKIFGLPRPYTGLYSSSSYMANRPSYVRNREPGQYTLGDSTSTASKKTSTSSTSSLGRLPGVSAILSPESSTTSTQLEPKNEVAPRVQSPDDKVRELVSKLPPAPTKAGVTTETVTKRTFSETTVKRVTTNENVPTIEDVVLVKAGGPLGLSIIGGSDHSCVPFGTGDPGIFISKVNKSHNNNGSFYLDEKITTFFRSFPEEPPQLRANSKWVIEYCQ